MKNAMNNIKLGVFVLGGLLFLVVLLYMIGINKSMFGGSYILKARFDNVQGLIKGNNVRFAGIQCGTVKNIKIISDTVIEVTMSLDKKMASIIRKNALASIGTEGLVGNKVVNIIPVQGDSEPAAGRDIIASKKMLSTDDLMQTLSRTNDDLAVVVSNLKTTVLRINNSNALWSLLNDNGIPMEVKNTLINFRKATGNAVQITNEVDQLMMDVRNGKGSLGVLLTDTSFATHLDAAVLKIKTVGERADSLALTIHSMASAVQKDMDSGNGAVHALLKDSSIVIKLNKSLENIEKGTQSFSEDMEALKHNFLLRGYFKKQEKKKQAENKKL
ncbi:MAG: MCE family protein [Bacteroidetes bacterium]|nr:MCE family protein [Bacteroidota bacterium]